MRNGTFGAYCLGNHGKGFLLFAPLPSQRSCHFHLKSVAQLADDAHQLGRAVMNRLTKAPDGPRPCGVGLVACDDMDVQLLHEIADHADIDLVGAVACTSPGLES